MDTRTSASVSENRWASFTANLKLAKFFPDPTGGATYHSRPWSSSTGHGFSFLHWPVSIRAPTVPSRVYCVRFPVTPRPLRRSVM